MSGKTSKIIQLMQTPEAAIHHAVVESSDGRDTLILNVSGNLYEARIAFSCLVRPQPEDKVMFTRDTEGVAYILGIVDRPQGTDMRLSFPGNTHLENRHGSLSMTSSESLHFVASDKFSWISDQTACKSREASFDFQQLFASGKRLSASYQQVKLFSQSITTMAQQLIGRFKQYVRQSEETDQVRAAQMSRDISGLYTMDSKYTIMVSKKDTKIDGQRIHMG